jgi:hypothetical protein
MDIADASRQLYSSLKEYKEVVGSGVQRQGNGSYIVIYLSEATQSILEKIPPTYYGNVVKTIVSGSFFS